MVELLLSIFSNMQTVPPVHCLNNNNIGKFLFVQNIHRELEEKLASFHGREDAILYASCFDANAGIFEVLLSPEDAVISDELNHASIIDGIRLCKAQRHRYLHKNMEGEKISISFIYIYINV